MRAVQILFDLVVASAILTYTGMTVLTKVGYKQV
jgi:hypothetical protein